MPGSGTCRRAVISSSAQVGDDGGPGPLAGDGQDAGNVVGVLGMLRRGVGEHRVDRGQPQVPGPGGVAPLVLEVVEETADQRGAEIGEVQVRGCLAPSGKRRTAAGAARWRGRSGWCGRWPGAAASAGR